MTGKLENGVEQWTPSIYSRTVASRNSAARDTATGRHGSAPQFISCKATRPVSFVIFQHPSPPFSLQHFNKRWSSPRLGAQHRSGVAQGVIGWLYKIVAYNKMRPRGDLSWQSCIANGG